MPLNTLEHLPKSHRERLEGENAALLESSLAAEQALHDVGIIQPYVDPAFRSSMTYGHFIRDLLGLGLLEPVPLRRAYLGCLFVRKKDGRMRLILDTRVANAFFLSHCTQHCRPRRRGARKS